jgi:hypothetical protein
MSLKTVHNPPNLSYVSVMYFHFHLILMSDGGTKHLTQTGATVVDSDVCKAEDCEWDPMILTSYIIYTSIFKF